jgi:RHS repeat-associated protein
MLLPDWLDGVRRQLFPGWFSRPARRWRSRLRQRGASGHLIVAASVDLLEERMLLSALVASSPSSVPQLAVADYTSSHSGALVHVLQTGPGEVVFVDRLGNMVEGTSINSTQMLAPGYANQTATYSPGIITWSDGTIWTLTAPNPGSLTITDYITDHFNLLTTPVHDIRNSTNELAIVDGLGRTSVGTMVDATTASFPLYPEDFAHYSGNQVHWDDGVTWTKVAMPSISLANDTGTSSTDGVTSDPTIKGSVSNLLDVASVEAAFDTGNGNPGFLDITGKLVKSSFVLGASDLASILGGPLTDGTYKILVRARDTAGNLSGTAELDFTLDRVSPTVSVSSPDSGLVTQQNVTITGTVADERSGVALLEDAVDGGSFAPHSFDTTGSFSLTTALALDGSADGEHTVHLRATDVAGNVSSLSDVSFDLETAAGPTTDFSGWTTGQLGGTGAGTGTVTIDPAGGATLVEGNSFNVTLSKTLTIPAQISNLVFSYRGPTFDTTSQGTIKDAFEVAFVDANGHSLLQTIGSGRDAFFNISENQAPTLAAGVSLSNGTVTASRAGLQSGTTGTLIFRLVNNDRDTTTSVRVNSFQFGQSSNTAAPLSSQAALPAPLNARVDFSSLSDVTTSFSPNYGTTTFDQQAGTLYADLSVKNTGTYTADTPLIVAIEHISNPSVFVVNADGKTPDGAPFFDYSSLFANHVIQPGDDSQAHTLVFHDPQHAQFTYDLQMLAQLNRPPAFTSQPNTQAIPRVPYVYQAAATDADNDPLTFSLLTAPAGMTVDSATGKVTWSPQSGDLGNQSVLLQVADGHDGVAQQHYLVATTVAPPNRPPLFMSTPDIQANVDTSYAYQAAASDPDGNSLTFSLTSGPAGMSVTPGTGLVSWTPDAAQIGAANVTLAVDDGNGGTASQSYVITVLPSPQSSPPLITSNPVTQYNVLPAANPPAGSVDPNAIQLNLGNGQTSNQTVSQTGLSGGPLTLGKTVNGLIGTPGQQDVFTIALVADALLYFDSMTNNGNFEWSLTGPTSTVVNDRTFTASDANPSANPVLALHTGTYTLVVEATASTVGGYLFRLLDLASAAPLAPGVPVSGTLNPANSTDMYQFHAAAGQSFDFTSLTLNGSFNTVRQIVDPYGNVVFSNFFAGDAGRLTFAAAGTYTVLIEGSVQDSGSANYSFTVSPINDTTQPVTLGATVNGALASGQLDRYNFNLAAGKLLYFDALTNVGGIQWTLTGPGGTAVSNLSFTASDGGNTTSDPVLSLPAGAYTLTISGTVQATGTGEVQSSGAYAFRLLDLSTASGLTIGTAVNDTLNPANSTNLYQFTASAGDQYTFTSHGGTKSQFWRLIGPSGNVVTSALFSSALGPVTLAESGTYNLAVEGAIDDTGTTNYSLTAQFLGNKPPAPPAGTPLTLGATVNGNIATSGHQDFYNFTLTGSALVYFDSLTNSGSIDWSLSGPTGAVVSNRQLASSDAAGTRASPVLPLPSGVYVLTIAGVSGATGAYSFRLSDLASASAMTPGTPVSDTLTPGNSTNLYKFQASAGQSIYFAALAADSNVWWRLVDPFGNVLFSQQMSPDVGRVTLIADGTYTVLAEGLIDNTSPTSFSFNAAPVADTTGPLALNTATTGNLSSPGQQDVYSFNLSAKALLYFDALTNNANFNWTLAGPPGTVVSNRSFTNSDANISADPVLALPAGAYSLTVDASGQTTGGYSFRLSDLSKVSPLTPGAATSGTLNPGNSTDLYQFNAAVGTSFYFAQLTGGAASGAWWRLIDPYGNVLFSTSMANDAGRLTLGVAGTYTLLAEGQIGQTAPVAYSFNAAPITDTTQPLNLGSSVSGSLATPGELDNYTFNLSSSALLYFDSLTNSGALQWSLTGPAGLAVHNRIFNGSDGLSGPTTPILSVPAGSYTLTVSAPGQTTGAYAFRLSDIATATALTPGTPVSGTLNPADSADLYRFTATAGQLFYFAGLSCSSANTIWRLVDPLGNIVFSTAMRSDAGRLTLSSAGAYTLLVEGSIGDTGTVGYSFNVAAIADTSQAMTLGSPVSGTLAAPGEQDSYTFNLAAGAQLYFDSLSNNGGMTWSLTGPAGAAVSNRSFTASDAGAVPQPALLLPAGAYTLVVSGTGQTVGAYSFELSDLSLAATLTPSVQVTATLNPANSSAIYQFAASAGDQYTYSRQSGGSPNGIWQLLDPYGNVLLQRGLGFNLGPLTLPASGMYHLLIEGGIAATGTQSQTFTAQFLGNSPPVPPTGTALSLGSTVNGNIATSGQQDHYTFTLAASAQLYFDSLTNNSSLHWSLSGPDAATAVVNLSFTRSDAGGINLPVPPLPAGNYLLTVDGSTGAYAFRLSDIATASALTPGTPVSGSLSPANSTSFYKFSAAAGQTFYFARLSGSGGSVSDSWKLIDPYGKTVFSLPLNTDGGRLTLRAAGTYTVLVEGFVADTGTESYSFNVAPISDAIQALTLTPSSVVTGNLAEPGQQDQYSFSLASSAMVYFDSLTNRNDIQWSLRGPGGAVVTNRTFSVSDVGTAHPVLAMAAGSYTLTVDAQGQATGAYSFRLSDLSTAGLCAFNTPVTGKLTQNTNFYQFTASAGDSYFFESVRIPFTLSSSDSAQWRLVDPYGNFVFNVALGTNAGRITLPATGAYTLLLEGAITNTGALGYAFLVDTPLVQVVASDPTVPFTNQGAAAIGLNAATFNVQFQGDGQAQQFDLEFVSPASGIELGAIPVTIDTQYAYQVRAVDPQGEPLTYALMQAPSGMQIDPVSGLITWVPTLAQVGQNPVSVRVEDAEGGTDTQNYVVTVTAQSPGIIQGSVYNDQNGDGTRNIVGGPPASGGPFQAAGAAFPAIGADSGPAIIMTVGPDGTISTSFTGQGPYDGQDDTYVAVVNAANSGVALQALQVSSAASLFGFEGDGIDVANETGGNTLAGQGTTGYEGPGVFFSDASTINSGRVNFDDGSGNGLQPGQETYFSLEDVPTSITGVIIRQSVPVAIEPPLANRTVFLDLNHDGRPDPGDPTSQTDASGHYFFSNVVPGTYTVALVGQVGWQQTAPLAGSYTATVLPGQVTSGLDFGVEQLPTVTPRPPRFTSAAPTIATAGTTYRYTAVVSNPDSDVLQFDLPVKPEGMVVDQETGIIDWEPTAQQIGPQDVILRLTDNAGDDILQKFTIHVGLESPPVITSTPPQQPAITGLPWQYQVEAQDAENDPLTYSLELFPAGMTIDAASGLVSWIGAPIGAGLPGGYQVTVRVSDGHGGQDSQTFTVLVVSPGGNLSPVIISQPPTQVAFGENPLFYQVVAGDPDGDPLTYSLPVAPTGMTISVAGLVEWQPTPSDVGLHQVEVVADDGRGQKAKQDFPLSVVWQTSAGGLTITSVPPESAGAGFLYAYNATADVPNSEPVIWSLDTAPAGLSVNPDTGTVRWMPTLAQLGTATVVMRATDTSGAFDTQTFGINVLAGNLPPNFTSNPPTQATVGQAYNYPVGAVDFDGDTLTYSLAAAPSSMTIDPSSGLIQWTPSAGQLGPQTVVVHLDDGREGQALQAYTIVVASAGPHLPPVLNSSPPLVATVGQSYSYQPQASDPAGEALSFSLPSAPAGMSIDPGSGLVTWTPTSTQLGANPVVLQVADPEGNVAMQRYSIDAKAVDSPPVITSTAITTVTAGAPYNYDVIANDPDGDPITYTLPAAPAGMTIDNLGRIAWSPQVADIGSQPVTVTASDGRGGTKSQSFTLVVSADTQAPTVSLLLSENPANLGDSVTVVVSASDNVGVTTVTLTEAGVAVPIDASGRAIIHAGTAGNFDLVATASDAAGNVGTSTQTLQAIDPRVTNAPIIGLTAPADNSTVTAPTAIMGTVQDANLVSYTLAAAPVASDSFTTFFTGTSQVTNGVLGTFDPTLLQNDSYVIRLTAVNTGGLSSSVDITVQVSQNLKLGNFTLSFTDLTIPVSGIPITVTRTYDTLTANQSGNFGYGWNLEFRDVDLRTSVASTGEETDGIYNPFQVGSHVYVTLPGGNREGFTFQPTVASGLRGSFVGIFNPAFVPEPGVTDSMAVTPADLRIDADGSVYDFTTGEAYNPASGLFGGSYLLTTKDGIAYNIDGTTGLLTEVSDTKDNTLTFSDSGITSSAGTKVIFERDALGRIATIVDPIGNRIAYQYDPSGNLVAVTDRTGNTTQFDYLSTPAHYLDKVIDPLGRTGVRTNYDADGRLVKVIDASGNPVQIAYDPTHSLQTITDQLGNQVIQEYDARGNTVSVTDELGDVTHRTYDANNNMLTETDPLGRTTTYTYDSRGDVLTKTDPLGQTTISTYQAFTFGTTALAASYGEAAAPFTAVASATDALGNTTSFTYGFFGEPESISNAMGDTTKVSLDADGNPSSITDADGNTTQNQYGAAGNLVLHIDSRGNSTAYTSDANGNQLTATTTLTADDGTVRTLTTATQYDAQGRVISVTDADGGITRTEYDAAGNKTASIDALGRRTTYVYDSRNRLIETDYPDGSTTKLEYNAAGLKTASIDELGRRTEYQYDAAARLVKTIYPDGSTTQTVYDAAGEATARIDQLGNRTAYQYDADGHLTVTRDALGNTTTAVYDVAGNKISQTAQLGHKTSFVYDAAHHLIETDYPDGTKTTTTYDANGQVNSSTDQLRRTTRYEYDALGRLTAVIDPLNQRTEYTYDEAGDLISQKDSSGHVTTYAYDGLGHRVGTVLPMGQSSTATYDAVGNVVITTDFNGDTITFKYDARNRLVAKNYPDGTSLQFTYTATGQLAIQVDARGTTSYKYDSLDRLLSRTDPDGTIMSYAYDAAGNRTAVTTPAGTTTYTFDSLNRESTVTAPNAEVTTYTYDAAGNLTKTQFPNGTEEDRTYNSLNRLILLQDSGPAGVIFSDTYTLASTGRIDAEIDNTGRRVDYSYDALDRLTQEKITDAVQGNRTLDYTYDAVGNRLTRNDSGPSVGLATYTYDANYRLISENDAGVVTQYAYDKNGNILSAVSGAKRVFYTWDFDNRLVTADTNGDGTIDEKNDYDANGNLVSQTVGGQETRFLIDTVGPIPQVLLEYRPGGAIAVSYVYGIRLISQNRGSVESFYVADHLGSTRALTNAIGLVTDRYTNDAFGVLLQSAGATLNTHVFLGEQFDQNLGFIDLRARDMNPELGRFDSRDPFPASLIEPIAINRYDYAGENPVNRTDPTGLDFDLAGFSVAQACQMVLAEIGFFVGFTYGRAKGGSLLDSVEDGVLGAAIGFVAGSGLAYFLPAAATSAPAASSGLGASMDAYIAANRGAEAVEVADAAQKVAKTGGFIKYAKYPTVPIPGLVITFGDILGQPHGYSTVEVLRAAIQELANESVGDPIATNYYQTMLASLKEAEAKAPAPGDAI